MKKIYEMQVLFYTQENQSLDVAEGEGTSYRSEISLKGTSLKSLNPIAEIQNIAGITKHNLRIGIDLFFNISGINNYNFIFHNFMKQLSFLLKHFGFLMTLLSFGSHFFRVKNERWDGHFKNRFSVSKSGLATIVLLWCMSSFVHAAEVDLAIKQIVNNATPSTGGAIKYTVYLVNQGNSTATNIVVENKVPITGLASVSATQSSGSWSYNGTSGVGFWTVPSIAGGDSVRLEINGVASAPGVFFNIAQILTSPDTDIDSVPGNTSLTEDDIATSCFSVPIEWYAGDEYKIEVPAPFSYGTGIVWFRNNQLIGPTTSEATVNADNSLTIRGIGSYTFTTSLTNCLATVCCPIVLIQRPIFDLAFTKTSNVTTVATNGQITYNLNVINQGNVAATAIQLSDYIPAGLTLADANWTQSGGVATLVNPIAALAAGASETRTITFNVSPTAAGLITNSAEISSARGPLGELMTDVDSTPDGNSTNDGVAQDNNISGNGKAGGDEDDSDYSDITVTALASIGNFVWLDANQNGIQDVGETGISGVNVTLQRPDGSVVATTTTDINGQYLFINLAPGPYQVAFGKPSGYTFSTPNIGGNDAINSDADAISGKTGTYVLVAGQYNQTVDAGFYLLSCADIIGISALDSDICSGDSTYLIATSSNGLSINWYLVPSGGTPLFTTNSGQSRLVYPTTTTVYYAQLSTIATSCPTDRTPVALVVNQRPLNPTYGKLIEVCTGQTTNLLTHIINGPTTPGGVFEWHTGFLPASPLVSNPLAVGAGNYYLFEKSGAGCYSNPAMVTVVAKSCTTTIDLSLLKTADRRTVNLNENILYTIQLSNAGPDVATNVKIEDKLPSGLQFVSSSTLTNTSGVLTTTIPSILSGQTLYFYYTAKAVGSGSIINVAEVLAADQRDSDSTPGNGVYMNEDDDDDEVINILVPNSMADLSLQKLVSNLSPSVGDNVIYTIRVSNAGPNNATNVEVKDILPVGLTLVSITGADINISAESTATATFSNILAGSSEEFYITAKVIGSGSILNRAEVTKSDQLDPDSTPNNGGNEDDDDTNTITVQAPCNPTTPLISCANPYICLGESVSVSAIGCNGTVVWSNGMTGNVITVNPSVTTIYNARCQVGTCTSPNSNNVQIIVNAIAPPLITASSSTVCAGGSVILTATGCAGTVKWSNGQTGSTQTLTLNSTQTFSATCTTGNCVSPASNSVSLNVAAALPAPVITSTSTVVCNGSGVTLNATNCLGNILWSNGMTTSQISVSPVVNTAYTAICRSANQNCDSPSSNSIVVTVSPIPNAPVITSTADRICLGESLILTAIGCGGTVTWNYNNATATGNTLTINPAVTTVYTTTCTIGNCVSPISGAATITVGSPIPPIITGNNTAICSGASTTLEAVGCVGTVKWSNGMEGSVISVSPTALTTYYAVCVSGICQSGQSNAISVVVSGIGVAKPTVKDMVNVCPNTTVDLTAAVTSTAPVGGTYVYRSGSTPQSPVVSNPTSISTTGTYYVFTSMGNGCFSEGSRINVGIVSCGQPQDNCITSPAIASSGANETYCVTNDFITLNGSIGGAATSSKWTSNGTGTFENSITPITKYFVSAQDITNGTVTLTLTTNDPDNAGPCQAATSSKVLTINGVSAVPIITTNKSPIICLGDSVLLTASVSGTNTYLWSNGATTRSILVKTPGSYTVQYVNAGGCRSVSSAVTQVNLSSSITPPTVIAQAKNTCPASTVNLVSKVTSTPTTIGGVYEYHVNNNPTSPMLASTNAVGAGTYYVFEKTLTGCYSNSAAITVAIDNCNIVQGDADIQVNISGNKTSVVIGDEVIYTIQVKNNGPAAATNVIVLNELPEGLIVKGGTPGLLTEGTNLKIVIPTLAVGVSKTYTYTAKLSKAGKVNNVVKKVSADQNDPINSNNIDNFVIECNTCQETCIATAFKADTIRQSNGSFNIRFTASLKNCGNVALSGVELDQNLSTMFPSTATFTIIQKPTPNATSTLAGNDSYNGTSNIAVLNKLSSTLPVGKTETVVFVINLLPMGTVGPYATNAIAKGVGMTAFGIAQNVSDVSNDGSVVVKELADPTVVKLFMSPSLAIVLAVKDTVRQTNGSYNVTFQAIVKNNGSLDLSNVIVTDTLSKHFGTPASFTIVGNPSLNLTSLLAANNAFNGTSDTRLTLPTSKLSVGKQDTIVFTINLITAGIKEFQNEAIASGTGTLTNGTISTVKDVSNSGVDPNIPGSRPTTIIFGSGNKDSEINTCVGLAVTSINKTKLQDGTYNITYQAIVKNCGNLALTNVAICDTLSNTFSSPTVAKVVVKPFTNAGSTLVADTTFNGITNTCLLKAATSSLASGKTDTLRWTINLKLNSNKGPFRNNITVNSTSPSGQVVSDVSNDGINPAPAGSTPTILNFNDNIRDEVIGLAKNLVSITAVPNKPKVFDVEFGFVLKNFGNVPFSKVQLQDNLSYTFGDKVIIDSVYIKKPETGLVANSNYTGKGELINLLADSLSTLPLNTSKTVGLVVRVDMSMADTLKYENIALARGHYSGGLVTDASATGLNPDDDLSGDPTDDSDPTLIDFTGLLDLSPITPLGIAKSVDTLGSADGSYLLTYKVIVKNFGSTELDSLQLSDNLADVFSKKTQFVLMGLPTLNDSSKLKINAKYDGDSVKTMLIANQSSLAAGKSDTLTFKVKVINNDLKAQTYLNTVIGTAVSGTTLVSDKSNSGALADKNNDGNPGNDNEPTGITLMPASQDTSVVSLVIYDGLTPNGDGLNDVLVIKDKENKVTLTEDYNISVYIYNRWGYLVFESVNYFKDYPQGTDTNIPNGWDGTSNTGVRVEKDKYVPDGTYYYVISSTNTRLLGGKPIVNFITVKR